MEIAGSTTYYRDLTAILKHFDSVGAESTAIRFVDALDETIQLIMEFPDIGSPWGDSSEIRYHLVKRFENYVVIYRRTRVIQLLRVSQGSQDLGAQLN